MIKTGFPVIHFYDQDFVDIYNKTWLWLGDFWKKGTKKNGFQNKYYCYPESTTINQYEACLSTFFLVYSNSTYSPAPALDNFYNKQEDSGAIRGLYNEADGKAVFPKDNPECLFPPLFAWAEFNIYHKVGLKKRLKEVIPVLERYYEWIESKFQQKNGLFKTPLSVAQMDNTPRDKAAYLIDFNSQMALNAYYMSAIGDILNDKEISFKYKKKYYSLKTRIDALMWDEEDQFYYDLNRSEEKVKVKTLASYWTMLAQIPSEDKAEALVQKLMDGPFSTENPFPSLATDSKAYNQNGKGYCGSVYPHLTFMVIKGLEKYDRHEFARECAIRHLYFMLDALNPDGNKPGELYEAYSPITGVPSKWEGKKNFPRKNFLSYAALSTITLMIENVIGLDISLPRKTVDWVIPLLEIMGIQDLSLKRNMITILVNKSGRGWEVRMESEKLYYFTINILGGQKKRLPIPSGKSPSSLTRFKRVHPP